MKGQRWWMVAGGLAVLLALLATGALIVFVAAGGDDLESADLLAVPGDDGSCNAADQQSASLQQIRLTSGSRWIEFELRRAEPFHMRALPWVLVIGSHSFDHYRYPDDGRLDTLIFQIPFEDFTQMNQGDPVAVFYGFVPPPGLVSGMTDDDAGVTGVPFEKRLLDCPHSEST